MYFAISSIRSEDYQLGVAQLNVKILMNAAMLGVGCRRQQQQTQMQRRTRAQTFTTTEYRLSSSGSFYNMNRGFGEIFSFSNTDSKCESLVNITFSILF